VGLEVYWLEFAENKLDDIFSYYSEKADVRTAQKLAKGIID
jgi:plasmid stabilization system protein ParE